MAQVIAPRTNVDGVDEVANVFRTPWGWTIEACAEAGRGLVHARIALIWAKMARGQDGRWNVSDVMLETARSGIFSGTLFTDETFRTRREACEAVLERVSMQAKVERREALSECSANPCTER